jgi:hypothetical protein
VDAGLPLSSTDADVLIALVTAIGTVLVAGFGFLAVRANQTRNHVRTAAKDSAISRDQLQNSHPENFRDDLDAKFLTVGSVLEKLGRDLSGIKRDVGRLADADLEQQRQAREDRSRLTTHIETTKENE